MENINYYQKEFKKIQSLDKPKLKLDCEHDESEWLDINRESIEVIISEFKKIREKLLKPTPKEWNDIMTKTRSNPNLFFKLPNIFGEYFWEYFLGVVPPYENTNDYIICGDPYTENLYVTIYKNNKKEYFIAICEVEIVKNISQTKLSSITNKQAKILFENNEKIFCIANGHLVDGEKYLDFAHLQFFYLFY
jgi:hypothetical protein